MDAINKMPTQRDGMISISYPKNPISATTADLINRLRENAEILPHEVYTWLNPLLLEAAKELERLAQS